MNDVRKPQPSLEALARTVTHLIETRSRVSDGALRSYDELINLACRKVDEIAPLNVSKSAHEEAVRRGVGDLRDRCWHCPEMGRIKAADGKRLFLWEHFKPAADIRDEVLAMGPQPRHEDVVAVLGQTKIVWVVREEGVALGNTSRPDPAAHYRDRSVHLQHPWSECRPLAHERHHHRRGRSRH